MMEIELATSPRGGGHVGMTVIPACGALIHESQISRDELWRLSKLYSCPSCGLNIYSESQNDKPLPPIQEFVRAIQVPSPFAKYKTLLRVCDSFDGDAENAAEIKPNEEELEQQLQAFLAKEQAAMNQRIKDYTERQRVSFDELKSQTLRERYILLNGKDPVEPITLPITFQNAPNSTANNTTVQETTADDASEKMSDSFIKEQEALARKEAEEEAQDRALIAKAKLDQKEKEIAEREKEREREREREKERERELEKEREKERERRSQITKPRRSSILAQAGPILEVEASSFLRRSSISLSASPKAGPEKELDVGEGVGGPSPRPKPKSPRERERERADRERKSPVHFKDEANKSPEKPKAKEAEHEKEKESEVSSKIGRSATTGGGGGWVVTPTKTPTKGGVRTSGQITLRSSAGMTTGTLLHTIKQPLEPAVFEFDDVDLVEEEASASTASASTESATEPDDFDEPPAPVTRRPAPVRRLGGEAWRLGGPASASNTSTNAGGDDHSIYGSSLPVAIPARVARPPAASFRDPVPSSVSRQQQDSSSDRQAERRAPEGRRPRFRHKEINAGSRGPGVDEAVAASAALVPSADDSAPTNIAPTSTTTTTPSVPLKPRTHKHDFVMPHVFASLQLNASDMPPHLSHMPSSSYKATPWVGDESDI